MQRRHTLITFYRNKHRKKTHRELRHEFKQFINDLGVPNSMSEVSFKDKAAEAALIAQPDRKLNTMSTFHMKNQSIQISKNSDVDDYYMSLG